MLPIKFQLNPTYDLGGDVPMPSIMAQSNFMVWEMLFEEFQDGHHGDLDIGME